MEAEVSLNKQGNLIKWQPTHNNDSKYVNENEQEREKSIFNFYKHNNGLVGLTVYTIKSKVYSHNIL